MADNLSFVGSVTFFYLNLMTARRNAVFSRVYPAVSAVGMATLYLADACAQHLHLHQAPLHLAD